MCAGGRRRRLAFLLVAACRVHSAASRNRLRLRVTRSDNRCRLRGHGWVLLVIAQPTTDSNKTPAAAIAAARRQGYYELFIFSIRTRCVVLAPALPLAQHPDFGVARAGFRPHFGKDGDCRLRLMHGSIGLAACMIQVCQVIAHSLFAFDVQQVGALE